MLWSAGESGYGTAAGCSRRPWTERSVGRAAVAAVCGQVDTLPGERIGRREDS
jgi:hypothetical protein